MKQAQLNRKGKFSSTLSHYKISILRSITGQSGLKNLRYASLVLETVQKLKTVNCMELSQLGEMIAKCNGYKDAHCVCLVTQDDEMLVNVHRDVDHAVLLINEKAPENIKKVGKYSLAGAEFADLHKPSKKAIVIDPMFGIVDFWDNAVIKYKTIFKDDIDDKKDKLLCTFRNSLFEDSQEIEVLKKYYPCLLINSKEPFKSQYELRSVDKGISLMKRLYPDLIWTPQKNVKKKHGKVVTFLRKMFGFE